MEVSAPFGQKWASLGLEVMLQFGHGDPREAGSSGQKFGHGRRLAMTFGQSSDMDSGREGRSARHVWDGWEEDEERVFELILRTDWYVDAGCDAKLEENEAGTTPTTTLTPTPTAQRPDTFGHQFGHEAAAGRALYQNPDKTGPKSQKSGRTSRSRFREFCT